MIHWQEPDTSTPGHVLCSVPTTPGCLTVHLFSKLEQESSAPLWVCEEKPHSGRPCTRCRQAQGSAGAAGERSGNRAALFYGVGKSGSSLAIASWWSLCPNSEPEEPPSLRLKVSLSTGTRLAGWQIINRKCQTQMDVDLGTRLRYQPTPCEHSAWLETCCQI